MSCAILLKMIGESGLYDSFS
jgi:hypothetical protein